MISIEQINKFTKRTTPFYKATFINKKIVSCRLYNNTINIEISLIKT